MLYLDHAASTPIDPDIREGLLARFATHYANPSSKHSMGRLAREELESARARLARLMGGQPEQLLFTGGGTEALGLAMLGSAGDQAARVAISAVEHAAVSESAYWLEERLGWKVDTIPVDERGQVLTQSLAQSLSAETRLVAVMMVNNEVGTINEMPALIDEVRRLSPRAIVVVDGVQAFAKLPMNVEEMGADLVALTSHKIHGPKGIGALWMKNPARLRPVFRGGGQEAGVRGGTQSAPLAWAFAEAAERQVAYRQNGSSLGERLFELLCQAVPDLELVGLPFGAGRAAHIVSIHLPGLPTGPLLNALSAAGVCCSAGSACTRSSQEDFSKVLTAMGRRSDEGAFLRMSVGRSTREEELVEAAQRFATCVAELREVYAS